MKHSNPPLNERKKSPSKYSTLYEKFNQNNQLEFFGYFQAIRERFCRDSFDSLQFFNGIVLNSSTSEANRFVQTQQNERSQLVLGIFKEILHNCFVREQKKKDPKPNLFELIKIKSQPNRN